MESAGNFSPFKRTRPIQGVLPRYRSLKRTVSPGEFRSEPGRHSLSGWQVDEQSSLRNQHQSTITQDNSSSLNQQNPYIPWQREFTSLPPTLAPPKPLTPVGAPVLEAVTNCAKLPHGFWTTSYSYCPAWKQVSKNQNWEDASTVKTKSEPRAI